MFEKIYTKRGICDFGFWHKGNLLAREYAKTQSVDFR